MTQSLNFEASTKNYFRHGATAKMLIWRLAVRLAETRMKELNEELEWEEQPFMLEEVLSIMVNEYEELEMFEAVAAITDACKYYSLNLL